ncbi:diacylglycerol kinase family lipid kinase [candidate division KSB1 bacterium]|nr:diacylglycerol kinase family lipid kinase [candidate division KSB1 bacterium]
MSIEIIYNVKSSRAKSDPMSMLHRLFSGFTTEFKVSLTTGTDMCELIARAKIANPDIIVIAGGDGSISTAAGELVDSEIRLGILPIGRFNHFARHAGIPLEMEQAVQAIFEGRIQEIDVGKVNGKVFINNSSIGFYPRAVWLREQISITWGGRKGMVMIMALLTMFKRFPVLRIEVEAGGEMIRRKTSFVFIGNNKYEMHLLDIGQRKSLQKGRLSLYTGNFNTRSSILRLIFFLLCNRLKQDRDFEYHMVRKVKLHTQRKSIQVSTDGEIQKMKTPLHYTIHPRGLMVMTPKQSEVG